LFWTIVKIANALKAFHGEDCWSAIL